MVRGNDSPPSPRRSLGALLASATQLPALGGASNVTQPAGSTPPTQGGRYNTSAVTAPVTQHGPSTLESATKLLGK